MKSAAEMNFIPRCETQRFNGTRLAADKWSIFWEDFALILIVTLVFFGDHLASQTKEG